MASYSIAEAKNRFSALIDAAERGEEVEITRYGRPVVAIVPSDHVHHLPPKTTTWASIQRIRDKFADYGAANIDGVALVEQGRDEDW